MNRWFRFFEYYVDKSIPYALIILLVVITIEFGFHEIANKYHGLIQIIDHIIIGIFIIDLIFKYIRIQNFPSFFRHYWIEILAVFPIFLVLRLFEELAIITELGANTQKVIHSAVEVEKESRLVVKEVERLGAEGSRFKYFSRYLRPIARLPRFFMAFSFYDKPHKHKTT